MTLEIVLLAVSLVVAAVAATAETALTSVSEVRIRTLCEEGNRGARRVARLRRDKQSLLGTVLLLNNVALIVAAQATTLLAGPGRVPEAIVTFGLSLVVYEVCELVPKSLAIAYPEVVSLWLSGPVLVLTRVLSRLVRVSSAVARVLVRGLSRGRPVVGPFVTEEDVRMMVTVGEEAGAVEHEERLMIHGVLELTDKVAREVMVPRVDIVGLSVEDSIDDVVRVVVESGHSRIPLFEDSIDNIVGVIYAKDVLKQRGAQSRPSLRELARQAYFTPETKRAGELLIEMRQSRVHMAVVVDEYGGTAGLVTIEDLIEEIVGEIRDEYDVAESDEIQLVGDREVVLSARLPLDEANELLDLGLDVDEVDADSIGGLVYERLGEIPKPGATLMLGDKVLIVDTVRRQAIRTVRVRSPHPIVLDRHVREPHRDAGDDAGRARGGAGAADATTGGVPTPGLVEPSDTAPKGPSPAARRDQRS